MKVLMISPNREHLPDPVYPLGLAYIAASLRKYGHEVAAVDLCFEADTETAVRNAVQDFGPDIVGLSLRNIDDVAYPRRHSYLQDYRDALDVVRRYSDAIVVLGGAGFSIMPEAFMDELCADFGIVGEGEEAFPALIEKIKTGHLPLNFNRIIRPREKTENVIQPDRGLFNTSEYYRLGGMLNVQTKRGCAFRCTYCTYPVVEGRRLRMRQAASVCDEIEKTIDATGARHFFFVDSIFNHPEVHAYAVCSEIIKRRIKIKWSCYATPAQMTEKLAEVMLMAGCTGVEFGTDSLSDKILANLKKGFRYSNIIKASEACRKTGLKFCHFIFAGAPGDTDETVFQTMAKLDDITPDAAVIMTGIRIFPNTKLAERAKEELGIRYVGLEPVFFLSPFVSDYGKVLDEVSKRKNWIMPGHEVNMHQRLQKKLREHGIKGPLWEELSKRC